MLEAQKEPGGDEGPAADHQTLDGADVDAVAIVQQVEVVEVGVGGAMSGDPTLPSSPGRGVPG